ncbi:MAG: N-methylhydantoinase B [Chloroflexi bacterium]|jgi:N-methylhydantoinase B|nr:MAG: N-methylhydantoinase B [Chloroflexota bacterium]
MTNVDVITREIIRARLDGVVREMQAAVLRTGFSTIIRESHDFSAGIADREGNTVGQFSPVPPHLGAYPECVKGVLQFYSYDEMEDGDCFLTNHPYYSGCPHPNDMVVVMPVFYEGEVVAFCCSMGHKSDIGGQSPGSRNGMARDVFGEGLHILPVKFLSRRKPVKEVEQFLVANSRTPRLVLGDLGAQAGALWSIGGERLKRLMDEYGKDVVVTSFEHMGASTEARVRQEVATWKDGVYEAEAFVDDIVNPGTAIRMHVAAIKEGESLILDFSSSGDQSAGPINMRPPFIRGMAYFALVAMVDPTLPNNFGLARVVECKFRHGSIVDPAFPGPVGFYSMSLSGVEDIIFAAMSQAAGRPAVAHNSPAGMVVLGNVSGKGRPYVQYELLLSGNGAYDGGDGWSGVGHSWSGGAKLANVEILESEFDVEMEQFRLIPDSGGAGRFRGGLGYRRDYRVGPESRYAGGSVRTIAPPQGMEGGLNGTSGHVELNPGTDRARTFDGLVSNLAIAPGDLVRVETGGSGGVGAPTERDPDRIVGDVLDGYITREAAKNIYHLSDDLLDERMGG